MFSEGLGDSHGSPLVSNMQLLRTNKINKVQGVTLNVYGTTLVLNKIEGLTSCPDIESQQQSCKKREY